MSNKATKEADTIIGAKIKEYRHMRGVTRQELAGVLGVTHQQLQKYERGTNRITASRLLEVAEHLNIHVMELLPGEGGEIQDYGRTDLHFMRMFKSLPQEQKKAFTLLVETLGWQSDA